MVHEQQDVEAPPGAADAGNRFSDGALFAAASLYYNDNANQATIAENLNVSRATVSRLLTEARRRGIVRIEVHEPLPENRGELESQLVDLLGLDHAYLSAPAGKAPDASLQGGTLAPAVSRAISDVGLLAGDVLLVSSGRTVYQTAQHDLPQLPGVVVVPTVGGQDSPEPWYQTNEIARAVAAKIGGHPRFLYAPALPGPDLNRMLRAEPSIKRVLALWDQARCALVGLGAPPATRDSLPEFVPATAQSLKSAAGDICTQFFGFDGAPVGFPGSDRLFALELDALARIPETVTVAVGSEKVDGIIAAAAAGYFNRLVTDPDTARAVIDRVGA